MKDNYEWEKEDLLIPYYMEVDSDIGQEITAYIGAWQDMGEKFGIKTGKDIGVTLHLYAKYNPFADTLRIEGEIDTDDNKPNKTFDYDAPECELKLVKMLIIEEIKDAYRMTPEEFCESATQRKHASQMDADEYHNAYEPFFPKSIPPYQPQDNATIQYSHISYYENGKCVGGGWRKGHSTYDDILTDEFAKSVLEDRESKTAEVKIEHMEYGNGSVHRPVNDDEFSLVCMTALANGSVVIGEEIHTISESDLTPFDDDESQYIGMTM